jgi:L-ascorbate metabolism protein UlaG (beta-lactamase superfamily)
LGILLTMDAEQGVDALEIIRPRTALPIHFDDYTLFRSPLRDFRALVEERELATEVQYLDRGESYPLRTTAAIPRAIVRYGDRRMAVATRSNFTNLRPTPKD